MCEDDKYQINRLFNIHNGLKKLISSKLPLDLNFNQFKSLVFLKDSDGLNQSELGLKLELKKSSISGLVEELLKKEYVLSHKDKSDKRINHLFLTIKGEEVFENFISELRTPKIREIIKRFSELERLLEV